MILRKLNLILIMLVLVCFLVSCNDDKLGAYTLEKDYGITLTNDLNLVFSTQKIGWPSDGVKMSIYEHDEKGTRFFEQFKPKSGSSSDDPLDTPFLQEKDFNTENSIDKYISTLEVPEEYYLDWSIEYSWKQIGGLFMFYFVDLNRIVFIALIL